MTITTWWFFTNPEMKNMRPSNLDHETPKDLRENSKNMNKTTARDKSSRDLSVFPHRFFRNKKIERIGWIRRPLSQGWFTEKNTALHGLKLI